MKPTRPETGYGYVQTDLSAACERNKEIFRVDAFKEKPDLKTAQEYVKKNNMLWNAGIFVWNINTIINALRVYAPQINGIFEGMQNVLGTKDEQAAIRERFPQCENISIDYAILEKADEIYCFPASFGWSDLGTWGSLRENTVQDAGGNAVIGNNVKLYETKNCVVHVAQERRVVVQGLDGYIVVQCRINK